MHVPQTIREAWLIHVESPLDRIYEQLDAYQDADRRGRAPDRWTRSSPSAGSR